MHFFYFQTGRPQSFSNECCVCFDRIGKTFVGAAQHLLRLCFLHSHVGIALRTDFDCAVIVIHKKNGISRKHGSKRSFHGIKFQCIRDSELIFREKLRDLCFWHLHQTIQQLPDHGILQRNAAHCHFYIDQQRTGSARFAEFHRADLNIIAIFTPYTDHTLIFRQCKRNLRFLISTAFFLLLFHACALLFLPLKASKRTRRRNIFAKFHKKNILSRFFYSVTECSFFEILYTCNDSEPCAFIFLPHLSYSDDVRSA